MCISIPGEASKRRSGRVMVSSAPPHSANQTLATSLNSIPEGSPCLLRPPLRHLPFWGPTHASQVFGTDAGTSGHHSMSPSYPLLHLEGGLPDPSEWAGGCSAVLPAYPGNMDMSGCERKGLGSRPEAWVGFGGVQRA